MRLSKGITSILKLGIFTLMSIIGCSLPPYKSMQIDVHPVETLPINEEAVSARLSKAVQIKTISYDDTAKEDYGTFQILRNYIAESYPLITKTLSRQIVNDYALLYEWTGKNPALKPILLTAHMDVVPAETIDWKADPFSGKIADGKVWGRGTLDDKGSLFAILEAVERLLEQGFSPERTIYFGFGFDEEAGTTGGMRGARYIAEYMKKSGIRVESELDEGGIIANEDISMIKDKKMALICVAEKGFVTLKISTQGIAGHSMMPPPQKDIAIYRMAKVITAVEEINMPSSLDGVIGTTFDYLVPEMPFPQNFLFANRWLFKWLLSPRLEKSRLLSAMMQTTVAPTLLRAGDKEQSLPATATLVVNFRILPGETSAIVIDRVRKKINDHDIQVELFGSPAIVHEPVPQSGLDSRGFVTLNRTIREIFPGTLVTPALSTGRTDSRYYQDIAETIFRFAPYAYSVGDENGPHGQNEFIRIADYVNMIRWYIRYLQNSTTK